MEIGRIVLTAFVEYASILKYVQPRGEVLENWARFRLPYPASKLRGGVQMYAIIETGGKQYKVAEGDIITVEKLGVEAGQDYTFDKVLVLAKDGDVKIGAPYVEGAAVTASVIGDGKEKKVVVYKYKPKKGFHKKRGHRQPFTKLQIKAL